MEVNNNNKPSSIAPSQSSTKPYLILAVAIISFIFGLVGGNLFNIKSLNQPTTNLPTQTIKTSPNPQNTNQLGGITYLMKYRNGGPENEKTIFITKDSSGESLKIANINIDASSVKQLYKLDFPSAIGFNPPIFIVNNYIIVPVAGADANDILIFTLKGDLISKGLRQNNTELSDWIISYDEVVKSNFIKVKLFQIDNSIATAQVDISTGKLVPGSLVKLGKIQQ